MLLSVIVSTRNRLTTIDRCLAEIRRNTWDYELIIADDSSSEAALGKMASLKADRILLGNVGGQLGAARNFNRAFLLARGDYITIPPLSDDCEVKPHWAERAIELLRDRPEVGWCSLSVYRPDGDLENRGGLYGRPSFHAGSVDYAGKGIAPRLTLEKVGLFDERYKGMYFEDLDWGVRVRLIGLEVASCQEARVLHRHQETQVCRPDPANGRRFEEKWGLLA